ncbi:MAG: 4a-hydroxytetrahydrobiopterin dehydratase [Actinomycetota bacterium]
MSELAQRKCEACEGGTLPLAPEEVEGYRSQIDAAWEIVDDGKGIRRRFKFGDFNAAFGFATRVALMAESEGHHPDFELGWGRVVLDLTTHAAGGLTDNDFIMAAKIDGLSA